MYRWLFDHKRIYKHTVINPRIFGVPDGVYVQLGMLLRDDI